MGLSFLFKKPGAGYRFSQLTGFIRNIFYLWSKTPEILSNKPYFYKVL
jgi:hypothetical protein